MARILIAEDDDILRAFVVRALDSDGHDLTEAVDGATAFAALNSFNGEFDLLLSDVKMPGMDGSNSRSRRAGDTRTSQSC
jgi:two-component system, cell cycle response regulator CpdR